MYFLGYDIGSSSIKVALVDGDTGRAIDVVHTPQDEMKIDAPRLGWAEQHPETWWEYVCSGTKTILKQNNIDSEDVKSIGISYQMHGLVLVDRNLEVLRPSIIWCDSRAIGIGEEAFEKMGKDYCLSNFLNSPGNFTASKLKWVKENEPDIYKKIYKVMLPGDYIAMKLTGEVNTTIGGLSQAILWNYKKKHLAVEILEYFGIDPSFIPDLIDVFTAGFPLHKMAAEACGLVEGIKVTYRAGDQPNNAMSLNVMNPSEIAATGGTSGVVYGVTDQILGDAKSRINAFTHVNYSSEKNRIGQLLCINGAGSQYAWIKNQIADKNMTYSDMENKASSIPIGSDGLCILPFGNGTERMLNSTKIGAQFSNVQFNIHTKEHFYRAALEGIAFSFVYGIEAMRDVGIQPKRMRVGNDNLFQSFIFASTICTILGCNIDMIDTTGAIGAAKASGIGLGHFKSIEEAIDSNPIICTYRPKLERELYLEAFRNWENTLHNTLAKKR